jgi:NADH:ubiquinone oxidoreductase subunit 5 (subunit L)/multisubunit Na+/H+ antiporter MnhA subunit
MSVQRERQLPEPKAYLALIAFLALLLRLSDNLFALFANWASMGISLALPLASAAVDP